MVKTQDNIRPVELLRPSEPEPVRGPEREVEHGPPAPRASRAGRRVLGLGALLILLGAVGYGGWRHFQVHNEVMATAEETRDFVPSVLTASVRASPATGSVFWPGSTLAFNLADIFARASGYIITRNVDIGSRVKKGDVLVEITAPGDPASNRSSQGDAGAKSGGAGPGAGQSRPRQRHWGRDKTLVQQGWVTLQQGDTDHLTLAADQAAVGVAEANIKAQQAQIEVLSQQQTYQTVVAPFEGHITQRNVDVGSLVQADNRLPVISRSPRPE